MHRIDPRIVLIQIALSGICAFWIFKPLAMLCEVIFLMSFLLYLQHPKEALRLGVWFAFLVGLYALLNESNAPQIIVQPVFLLRKLSPLLGVMILSLKALTVSELFMGLQKLHCPILYLLRRLNQENGVTIVMVLHDLNHAIMFSDYLVAIKDGILHSAGTPQEVITPQALREIFDVEAEVITHPVLNVPVCLPFRITEQNKKQEVRTHEKGAAISAVLRAGGCAAAVRRMRQIGRHLHGGRLYGFR